MRVGNNFGGLNTPEDQARVCETKNPNPTSKVRKLRSIQNTSTERQTPKTDPAVLLPFRPAAQPTLPISEILSFEEAQQVLKDTGDRALHYPNDFILAQARNKPDSILKLIS